VLSAGPFRKARVIGSIVVLVHRMGKLVPVVMVSPACGDSTVTGVARAVRIALDPTAADSIPIVASLGILHSILKE
jgi:hypothetical protein